MNKAMFEWLFVGFVAAIVFCQCFGINKLRKKAADIERQIEALSYRVDRMYEMEGIRK